MKETRFIAQNKEKWLESENLLKQDRKEPEKLSTLFTQVVDDLSYSRTYYPNRSVKVYLNKIAREYFSIIYSRQRDRKNWFRMFWFDELPQIVIYCRRELIISLILFFLALGIGWFSSMKDPQFMSSIFGDQYVEMTKANIAKGDPMAVYKSMNEMDMFLEISLNNLRVAFEIYLFGILLSIGTIAMLLSNGIMVGCFEFFLYDRGLFGESALAIWLHGTLEMSSFVIAGGAGITLGSGFIFPGTYSRLQAFQISAIRSLKLMLGIAPIIVFAAIIESFVTRYTDVPDFIRLLLIIASLVFIVGYFIVYPWMRSRSGFEVPLKEVKLTPSVDEPANFTLIKNNAEILKDAFLFYKNKIGKIFPWILGVALVVTTCRWFLMKDGLRLRFLSEWWQYVFGEIFFGMGIPNIFFIVINALGNSIVLYVVYRTIASDAAKTKLKFSLPSFLGTFLVMLLTYGILYSLGGWGVFLIFLLFLCLLIASFAPVAEIEGSFTYSIGRAWNLIGAYTSQVFILHIVLLVISVSLLMIMAAPLIYLYITFFKWNFAQADTWINDVLFFVEILIKILSFYLLLPILAACTSYLYYTLAEINDATHLRQSIDNFGAGKSKYSRR